MRIAKDCVYICKVIDSCESFDQFETAVALAHRFADKYDIREDSNEHLTPYADVVNDSIEEKQEELECLAERERPKIGFLR